MVYTYVRPHYRNGRYIKGFYRKTTGSIQKGRSGERFRKLSRIVAKEYQKKGYSKSESERIGRAVAGKVFWMKYGKKKGSRILRKER